MFFYKKILSDPWENSEKIRVDNATDLTNCNHIMSRRIRQELDISKRVYALACKLAEPFQLPAWNIIGTMTDEQHDDLVKHTTNALALKVAKLECQLAEANATLRHIAAEQEKELPSESGWVSVRSVV